MAAYNNAQYVCKITGQSFVRSTRGTPGFRLTIVPTKEVNHETGEETPAESNFSRDFTMWITEKSAPVHKKALQELGFNGNFSELEPSNENHCSLIGKHILLENTVEQSGDKFYDKFDYPKKPLPQSDPGVGMEIDRLMDLWAD